MATYVREIPDQSGNTLTVLSHNGRLFPTFPEEAIQGISTFIARPDDVIVCAYPKSGTHWVWEMVRLLLAGTTDLPVQEKDEGMIEDVLPEDLKKMTSPRPLNTHVHFEMLPSAVRAQKVKVIYISRDPRDVAVSLYHHHKKLEQFYGYKGEWKDHLTLFINGQVDYESWFAYTKGWEEGIESSAGIVPILVTSYEALHADTKGEVKRIAEFLGSSTDDTFLEQVVDKTSFNNMKATKGQEEKFGANAPVMYRKGKVGDWKNYFSVAEWEYFDAKFEKEMAGTKAYNLYSYNSKAGIYQNNWF